MRSLRLTAASTAACCMIGCAQTMTLHATELRDATRSVYSTFFVLTGQSSGNPAVDRDLIADIESALTDRGMVETTPEEAQAVVIVHTATAARRSRSAFYQGWGGWQWRAGAPNSLNGDEVYEPGALVVDIFDAWAKKLIWHGSSLHPMSIRSPWDSRAMKSTLASVFKSLPTLDGETTLDRSASTAAASDQVVNIIFSVSPAVLIQIDGTPRYESVDGARLERIVNTTAFIVRDEAGIFYMKLGDSWMEAYLLTGSWSISGLAPEGIDRALATVANNPSLDAFGSMHAHGPMPVVYVSTTPAELIVTDGDPEFVPLDGTPLLHVRNTSAAVFKEPTDQQLYVHVSSGWFRAWATNGPWQEISVNQLPSDLARTKM